MTKRMYAITAWLIAWLVLTMPVAAAQQLLTIQKFSGINDVEDFAREGDELTIEILAQMVGNPSPEVARQRAQVHYEDTFTFMDECTALEQAMYECTYSTTDLVYSGTDDYTIKLFDQTLQNEIASEEKTLTVDVIAPVVTELKINPRLSAQPVPTTITYKTEDYGDQSGKKTNCAGIKLLNITADNQQIAMVTAGVGDCSKEGKYVFTPTVSGPSEVITICAVATDHVNHQSLPVCEDMLIDSTKPIAQELVLRDDDGFVITHARSGQTINADVYVKIPDVDVDPDKVYADLSKLNPNVGKIVAHDRSNSWFIWRNLPITSPSTCEVTVDATDFMGNQETKKLSCTIDIDDDGPEPVQIRTQFQDDDGTPLLGINGTIIVEIREAGSGLDKTNVYLRLSELGLGSTVQADSCTKTGAEMWECYWDVRPTVGSGDYTVRVQPTSRDDLDNQVTGIVEQTIRFDKDAPGQLRIVEIAAFRGQDRVITNVTSLGETLEFVVEGSGFTTAFADFSMLGGGSQVGAESCDEETTKTCTFAVTTAVSGPQPTNITFTFSDIAGNTATLSTTELFILGISNETDPNYWTITTECSPSLLDRMTLSVYEHPVYCRLDMDTTNPLATPISVTEPLDYYSECTGQTEYLSNIRIENNYAGSTEPYMILSLLPAAYEINNLTFTCPVRTLTRVGNFIPQNFETDNATVKLEFYNLPLGELYNNIEDEVKDVEDSIEGVWDVIGSLQKFIGYAEKLCYILNMIINLLTTLTYILLILGITEEVARDSIPIVGAGIAAGIRAAEKTLCNPTEITRKIYNENLLGTLKKFCDFITCEAGLFDLFSSGAPLVGSIMTPESAADAKSATSGWYYDWISGTTALGETKLTDFSSEQLKGAVGPQGLQDPNMYLNVKDSLVYSIVIPPFCIPGIIYNLDKWRQIECRYGLCLLEEVKDQGLPVSVCKDQKNYMQCRFVVGEIFHLIPFAPLVEFYTGIIQRALSDPLVLVAMGIGILLDCNTACDAPNDPGIYYEICAGLSIASQLGDTVRWIQNIKGVTDFGTISNQWCEEFEDELGDFESERVGAGAAGVIGVV